jgi:hypothetical protein
MGDKKNGFSKLQNMWQANQSQTIRSEEQIWVFLLLSQMRWKIWSHIDDPKKTIL